MPHVVLKADYLSPVASIFPLLFSSRTFEEFHNVIQKHKEARGAEFEDDPACPGRRCREVSYVIPEHGVLWLLQQGDTLVTQKDVAEVAPDASGAKVVSMSTSSGGELASAVILCATWTLSTSPSGGTSLHLDVEYHCEHKSLKTVFEAGLQWEISDRHKRMLNYVRKLDKALHNNRSVPPIAREALDSCLLSPPPENHAVHDSADDRGKEGKEVKGGERVRSLSPRSFLSFASADSLKTPLPSRPPDDGPAYLLRGSMAAASSDPFSSSFRFFTPHTMPEELAERDGPPLMGYGTAEDTLLDVPPPRRPPESEMPRRPRARRPPQRAATERRSLLREDKKEPVWRRLCCFASADSP